MGSPRTEQPLKRGFPVRIVVLVVVGFVVMPLATILVVTGSLFNPKASRISSRTDACALDLQKGLESLRDEQGLPIDVTNGDGRALFDGSIDKTYQRDGIHYTLSFQAEGQLRQVPARVLAPCESGAGEHARFGQAVRPGHLATLHLPLRTRWFATPCS